MRLRDEALGTLVGSAVSDALGGAAEGWTTEQITERNGGWVTGVVEPFRVDARLSHVRNGVPGAMFVAAVCARAVAGGMVGDVVAAGLAVVPPQSRYADAVRLGVDLGRSGLPTEEALDRLYDTYGDLHWAHVLNKAALAAYALVATDGDFEQGICTAVMGRWDTDSVVATVGSVSGALPEHWVAPLRKGVATSLPGFDGISFDELAGRTLALARGGTR